MTRKTPTQAILKKLFAFSGNRCAFSDSNQFCDVNIVDTDGYIIGEICHIEAAEEGGERYNADSNDEYRKSYENLILLCSNHHKKTNNIDKYTVDVLKDMKRRHEEKYKYQPNEIDEKTIELFIEKIEININIRNCIINNIHNEFEIPRGIVDRLLKNLDEKDSIIQSYENNASLREAELKNLAKKYEELLHKESINAEAKNLIKDGKFEKAENLLSSLVNKNEAAAENASTLAILFELQLKYNEGLVYHQKAVELQPNNYIYWNNIGQHYYLIGNYIEAKKSFEKAIEIEEAIKGNEKKLDAELYSNLGLVWKRFGEYSKAIPLFEKAIDVTLKTPIQNKYALSTLYNNLGVIWCDLEKYQDAIEY